MTYENVKRLHELYIETGNVQAQRDLEYWYPKLKESVAVKAPPESAQVKPKKTKKKEKEDGEKSA